MKHIKLFEQYSNNSNFDTWFGESKMTENGKPKVYYHGVGRAGKFNSNNIDYFKPKLNQNKCKKN